MTLVGVGFASLIFGVLLLRKYRRSAGHMRPRLLWPLMMWWAFTIFLLFTGATLVLQGALGLLANAATPR
jgi:hypothetical protein